MKITRSSSTPACSISARSSGRIVPAQVDRLSALKGCYTLTIALRRKRLLRIGSLGSSHFAPGFYLYTGSALNGLKNRLSRYLRKQYKKCHWHIDYLLKCPQACIQEIRFYPGRGRPECFLNQRVAALPGAKIVAHGFGASDCKAGCKSHLLYFSQKPASRF